MNTTLSKHCVCFFRFDYVTTMFAFNPPPPYFANAYADERYAACDASAGFRLYGKIVELSDPIFGDAEELDVGDAVRLYTRGGNDCVGDGTVTEYTQEAWGTTKIYLINRHSTRQRTRRWAVQLKKAYVRRAEALYPDENAPPKSLARSRVGELEGTLLLWDANRMRRVRDLPDTESSEHLGNLDAPLGRQSGAASASEPATNVGGNPTTGSVGVHETATGGHGAKENEFSLPGHSSAGGIGGGGYVTPSESFFSGERSGIEALSEAFANNLAHVDGSEIQEEEPEWAGSFAVGTGDDVQVTDSTAAHSTFSPEEEATILEVS